MIVQLNDVRASFCFIGKYSFSFENPGPVDIDISSLSENEKEQLKYNLQRGILSSKDQNGFSLLISKPVEIKPIVTPIIPSVPILIDKDINQLLTQNVNSIKKEASSYSVSKLRKLLELESNNKARKGLLNFIQELLDSHTQSVISKLGTGDLDPSDRVKVTQLSTQLSDIVESDQESIVVNLDS